MTGDRLKPVPLISPGSLKAWAYEPRNEGIVSLPTPDAVQIALTVGSLAAAWVCIWKVGAPTWRWIKGVSTRTGAALDTLGGRPPIVDRVTGKELSPEIPALGVVLADMSDRLDRVANVNDRLDRHDILFSKHDKAISALIAGSAERAATALSSAALLNAVANADTVHGDTTDLLNELKDT